jgi:hypothetical protein
MMDYLKTLRAMKLFICKTVVVAMNGVETGLENPFQFDRIWFSTAETVFCLISKVNQSLQTARLTFGQETTAKSLLVQCTYQEDLRIDLE